MFHSDAGTVLIALYRQFWALEPSFKISVASPSRRGFMIYKVVKLKTNCRQLRTPKIQCFMGTKLVFIEYQNGKKKKKLIHGQHDIYMHMWHFHYLARHFDYLIMNIKCVKLFQSLIFIKCEINHYNLPYDWCEVLICTMLLLFGFLPKLRWIVSYFMTACQRIVWTNSTEFLRLFGGRGMTWCSIMQFDRCKYIEVLASSNKVLRTRYLNRIRIYIQRDGYQRTSHASNIQSLKQHASHKFRFWLI